MKRFLLFLAVAFLGLLYSLPVFAFTWATFDPLACGSNTVLTDSDLTLSGNGAATGETCLTTITKTTGKWYWEYTVSSTNFTTTMLGIGTDLTTLNSYLGGDAESYGYFSGNGQKYHSANNAYGSTFSGGDIIGVAMDLDNGTLEYFKNGVSQGVAFTGVFGDFLAGGSIWDSTSITANFGSSTFAYTVPDGFQPGLCAESSCGTVVAEINLFEDFLNKYLNFIAIIGGALLFLSFSAMLYKSIRQLQFFKRF